MKLLNNIILTEVSSEYMAVPVGESADKLKCIVKLNKTGKEIWDGIADGLSEDEIVDRLLARYEETDRKTVAKYVSEIVYKLEKEGILKR